MAVAVIAPRDADRMAWQRARRPKPSKLASNALLRAIVEAKLELRWSPEQIAGWLQGAYPDDAAMRVSHETIYLSLFVQSRGALRKELTRAPAQRPCDPAAAGSLGSKTGRGQIRASC